MKFSPQYPKLSHGCYFPNIFQIITHVNRIAVM